MFFSDPVEIHDDFLIAARWNHINHLAISKFNMAYFISYFIACRCRSCISHRKCLSKSRIGTRVRI